MFCGVLFQTIEETLKNPSAVPCEEKPAHEKHAERVVYGIFWGLARVSEVIDKEDNDEIDNVVEHKDLAHLLHNYGGVQNAWRKALFIRRQYRSPKGDISKKSHPNFAVV